MKFQSSAFTRIKLQIIPIILTATFLLLNSTPGQALWGEKIKTLDSQDLEQIARELRLYDDPYLPRYNDIFNSYYRDPKELLNILNTEIEIGQKIKEIAAVVMQQEELDGLTYGIYILNAINEKRLVQRTNQENFAPDQANGKFFGKLADDLADWKSQLGGSLLERLLQGVSVTIGLTSLSSGISTLHLAADLVVIGLSINELNKVLFENALWSYILFRKDYNYEHEDAWQQYVESRIDQIIVLSPKKKQEIKEAIEQYFWSLWMRYEKYILSGGLSLDFEIGQRKELKTLLLYALGAQAYPILTSPLEIAPSPSYYVADKITAEFTITNKGVLPITFSALTVGGRGPDDQVADFPFRRDITLHPDQYYDYKGALTLTNTGKYHFFCAYQTPDGNWNPSVDLGPGLTDKDRAKNIIVQLKEKPYLGRWKYRKKITIDHAKIDEDLTDFPVLVKLTSFNFDFLKARTDGYDIRFTDAAGNTLLSYERERHDALSQKAEYWVKIPSVLKDTDTEFYIYYCATDAPDGEDPTAVWDSDFEGVWHLKGLGDSTTNNNTLTNHGTTEVDGKIAKAKDFERDSSQYLSHADAPALSPTGDITIEFWVKHETLASNYYMTKWDETTNFDYILYMDSHGDKLYFSFVSDGDKSPGHETDTATDTHQDTAWTGSDVGVWRHVALTADVSGPTVAFYKDGLADTTTYLHINATSIHDGVTDFRIGSVYSSYYKKGAYGDGVLDEIRLSHTVRSAAWIKASYNSGNDSLLTHGSEEPA